VAARAEVTLAQGVQILAASAPHVGETLKTTSAVVSSTSAIPLASSRLLSFLLGSRRNSFSSRTSSSFRLMYHPLCHMVHSSIGKSPLEAKIGWATSQHNIMICF
jgi:hypothetical protein